MSDLNTKTDVISLVQRVYTPSISRVAIKSATSSISAVRIAQVFTGSETLKGDRHHRIIPIPKRLGGVLAF